MGNKPTVRELILIRLDERERTVRWLHRQTGIPYKALLAEVKHGTRPLQLDHVIAIAKVLETTLPALVQEAA